MSNMGDTSEKSQLGSELSGLFGSNSALGGILKTLQEQKTKLEKEILNISDLQGDVSRYDMSKGGCWQGTKEGTASTVKGTLNSNLTLYYNNCTTLKTEIDSAITTVNTRISNNQTRINQINARLTEINSESNS